MENKLETIIFNPLSYIHSSHFELSATFNGNVHASAIINEMLINHYQLSCSPLPIKIDYYTHYWLNHWQQLPHLALLIACQHYRTQLAQHNLLWRLPEWCKQFSLLALKSSTFYDNSIGKIAFSDLLCHGQQLLAQFYYSLPTILIERIPLLFPTTTMPITMAPLHGKKNNEFSLFILAIQYVKKYAQKLPALPCL